jgi:exoribonuclease R
MFYYKMKHYKFLANDRKYKSYSFANSFSHNTEICDVDVKKYHLLNHDIFTYNEGTVNILHSTVRESIIPGVLVLSKNIKMGAYKDKFLYRCIPDDKRIPEFIVPYKLKKAFSKKHENKYIIFKFKHWFDNAKYPIGLCVNSLGDTNNLDSFYEYQLYCKSLYASITQFNKQTMKKLRQKSEKEYIQIIKNKYKPEDRTNNWRDGLKIFSIDPENSKDFDDAFSIWITNDDTKFNIVSIYISNVSFWLDALDLWDSFSNRISTIYLPDRKRPMLPTVLSDALCSLTEGDIRFALTLDLYVEKNTGKILLHKFVNTMIKVDKNLRYDTDEMKNYSEYNTLFQHIVLMNKKQKYVHNIKTSHEVVAYLMIVMNYMCALKLKTHKTGIYRSAKLNSSYQPPGNIDNDIQKFLKMWHSYGGKYCNYNELESHDMLELDAYVHATSPIRRLVDLLVSIELQKINNFQPLSDNAYKFYNNWTNDTKLEYINTTMRSIRRVQNDCSLLHLCYNNEKLKETIFKGHIFDKLIRNDKLYQYMVYLPKINMVNRFTTRIDIDNYSYKQFKIFIFMDEAKLKQKIRLKIID